MNPIFTIPEAASSAFPFFYALACVAGSGVVFYEFHRRKYPVSSSFLIIFSCLVCGIIGTKIAALSIIEITEFLKTGIIPLATQKSSLGGIIGVLIGAEIARRLLGFKISLTDNFTFAWLAMIMLARLGCLLGGCCFGTPTDMPWGISYAQNFSAFHAHEAAGIISHSNETSLAVHPTQLYEILFCAAIIFILFKNKSRFKSEGNLFNISLLLYGICRFFEEFFRYENVSFGVLKNIQWILLGAIVILTAVIFLKEKYAAGVLKTYGIPQINSFKNGLLFSVITLPVILLKDWFSPLEFTTILIIAGLSIVIVIYREILLKTQFTGRFALSALILFTCILMGQAPVANDTTAKSNTTEYLTISGGGMMGEYSEICGPDHEYRGGGLGFSYTKQENTFKKITFGLRGYGAIDKIPEYQEQSYMYDSTYYYYPEKAGYIYGINPFIQVEDRWFGIGLGLHIGKLYADSLAYSDLQFSVSNRIYQVLPQGYVRLGPADFLFADIHYADNFPGTFPRGLLQIGLGTPFDVKGGTVFRFGLSDMGFYFNPYVVIDKQFIIDPFIAYGSGSDFQYALRLHYRIYDVEAP